MNCDDFARAIASGVTDTPQEREHMKDCRACARLSRICTESDTPALDAALEKWIVAAVSTNLAPVAPLRPWWHYALAVLAIVVAVAASGVFILGTSGWFADSGLQRAYFVLCLGAATLASATVLAQLMTPGALLLVSPRWTVILAIAAMGAGALLYPERNYRAFGNAIVACMSIGLAHATVACAVTFAVIRRGVPVRRAESGALVGLAGGLTGMAALYVFCPHRDLWHFLLGHTPAMILAAAIGAALAALRRTRERPAF